MHCSTRLQSMSIFSGEGTWHKIQGRRNVKKILVGPRKKIKNQSQLSSNQESPLSAFSDGHFSSRHQSITLREAKISRCMSWGKLLLCLMCLRLRGFPIDNCVFQKDLKFEDLKVEVYYQVVLTIITYWKIKNQSRGCFVGVRIVSLKHPNTHTECSLNNGCKF